jgi:hypothetical protein
MLNIRTIMVAATMLCVGCSLQSKGAALQEMCTIPTELMDKPTEIGPYLATRISNSEVMEMLTKLDDPRQLHGVLRAHDIRPEDCDLIRAIEEENPP